MGLRVVPVVFLFFFRVAILVAISHKYDLSLLSRQEVLIIPGIEFPGQERIVTCEPPSSNINSPSNMFLHLEFLVQGDSNIYRTVGIYSWHSFNMVTGITECG